MLFSALKYWWHIYAPFTPVVVQRYDKTQSHPHRGQVIQYARRWLQMTKSQVATELDWSPAYISKIEKRPEGCLRMERSSAITQLLHIPPELMDLSPDLFLPDTPDGARLRAVEQVNELLEFPERSVDQIVNIISNYQQRRNPRYTSLRSEEMYTYEQALQQSQQALLRTTLPPIVNKDPHVRERASTIDPLVSQLEQDQQGLLQVKQGMVVVNQWLEKIDNELAQSASLRASQLLYVQYYLYKMISFGASMDPLIAQELGREKRLAYEIKREQVASRLWNAMARAEVLLDRAKLYLEQQEDRQALEDIEGVVFCIELLCNVVDGADQCQSLLNAFRPCLSRAKNGTRVRMRTLYQEARQMVNIRTGQTGLF